MAQTIQHRRGTLERLSAITGSLLKGEILIVTGSSNLTASNGASILFTATENGIIQPTNRFIIGNSAPNTFSSSIYGGLVNGVPYYDSGSGTLYLLGPNTNTPINLTGNISAFSSSVATSFSASAASIPTWNTIASKPSGIISSSAQLPTGVISGSSQLTSSYDTRYVISGSITQTTWDNIASKPSGIVSGSSQITYTDLSNIPTGIISSSAQLNGATIDNLTITNLHTLYESSSVIYASGSNQLGDELTDIQTLSGSVQIQGGLTINGTQVSTQSFVDLTSLNNATSSYETRGRSIISSSAQITSLGFISSSQTIDTTSFATTGSNTFIGTQTITGSVNVSGTINPDNVTVGIPTSNAWQTSLNGSYFNNFTSETNVSEILRFVAGLLSASAPDASPNTKTLGSITATAVNTTTGTALTGRIPQSSTNSTITYLNGKGFATAGSTIFSGVTPIYTANLGYNYTSVASGTTAASSSADTQLFGLGVLSSGTPTNFKVSGSFTFRFMNNSSKTITASSSSIVTITQTGAGTTSGVTLALINTINPAVIPPGYQDGKFASALPQYLYSGSATAISASGYYHISSSIQIASGSSGYSTAIAANGSEVFYAPLTTITTNVPAQTVYTASVSTLSYLTAVSRSLSGAPYLSQSTYIVSSSLSGAFSPLFYNATIGAHTLSGTGITQTSGVTSVLTSGGTISTANAVYDSTNTTVRATSTIPFETDLIRLNGLYTFGSTNITNVAQTSFTPTTFTVNAAGNNYNGSTNSYANTLSYHVAGTFGQPSASGSLAYFTRTQGADTSTALIESFTGETYRIQLADNVLAFNGTAWTTTFALNQLSGNDLQVKPGYLVKPGGTYGYWLGDPDTSKTYKFYIRKFTTSGSKASMTLNLGQTLNAWDSSATGVSAVILFESSKNTIYTPARVYDPTKTTSNFVSTITANTDGQNPFGANIDLYGNTGGSLATTTYTIPLRNADGMYLNATYTNIYVIVRYKGDATPVTSITTTFT